MTNDTLKHWGYYRSKHLTKPAINLSLVDCSAQKGLADILALISAIRFCTGNTEINKAKLAEIIFFIKNSSYHSIILFDYLFL